MVTYIASDDARELVNTEGPACGGRHRRSPGVGGQEGGDHGTTFNGQVLGVRNTSKASSRRLNARRVNFKDGDGRTFPATRAGRSDPGDQVQFLGYGLQIPSAGIDDYRRHRFEGKIRSSWVRQDRDARQAQRGSQTPVRAAASRRRRGRAASGRFGLGRGAPDPPAAGAPGTPALSPAQRCSPTRGRGRGSQPDRRFHDRATLRWPGSRPYRRDEFFESVQRIRDHICGAEEKAQTEKPLPVWR